MMIFMIMTNYDDDANNDNNDDGGDLQPHGAVAIDGEEAKDGAVQHIARVSLIAFVTLIRIRYNSDASNSDCDDDDGDIGGDDEP